MIFSNWYLFTCPKTFGEFQLSNALIIPLNSNNKMTIFLGFMESQIIWMGQASEGLKPDSPWRKPQALACVITYQEK